MGFKVMDDGTLDTVLQCEECGEELRFPETSDIPEEDRIPYCLDLATETHECEAEEAEEAEEAQEEDETPSPGPVLTEVVGKLILINPEGIPLVAPHIVGIFPLFDDLVEAERVGAPYHARIYRLEEVE